jgi:hypothetical protein
MKRAARLRRFPAALPLVAALAGAATAGCGSSGASDTTAPVPADGAAAAEPDAEEFVSCAGDPRAEPYVAGRKKMGAGGKLSVTLMAAEPAPPIKGFNVWTVLVADTAGSAQAGATVKVTPWMPDHRHGPQVQPLISAIDPPGQYKVSQLHLFMAGLWQVTVDVTSAAGVKDAVVFQLCVDH